MYESLKKQLNNFHLYIFAFDQLCYDILKSFKLDKVTIINLKEFENNDLLAVKDKRTKAEYCWTCTPSTIHYVIENFKVPNCTYIDADLYFYQSPEDLIAELRLTNKNVLITEHRYNKIAKIRDEKRAGRFCVQFITFTNEPESIEVLEEWKNQCISWCFARYEDNKFGDQKYLDEWPEKYKNVHILKHLGGGVAPWNVNQYQFEISNESIIGNEKRTQKKFPLVFFHYHFVRFMDKETIDLGWNYLSKFVVRNLYKPYVFEILKLEELLESINPYYKRKYFNNNNVGFKEFIKRIIKKISKFNIIKVKANNGIY